MDFKTKKQLKEEILKLEKENKCIKQEKLSLLENKTINYEMLNMLKAIILKLGIKEIEIDKYLLEEADTYNIYKQGSYMKNAIILRLFEDKDIIKKRFIELRRTSNDR